MGCNPCAWQTDWFQLQLHFLPSLLLNWSWLCLVLQRSLAGTCNICYISCMYSCVLTRNIKIKDGKRQGEGEVKWNNINASHLGLPTSVPRSLNQTDFLPTDGTSLETQTSLHILKTTIVYRPLKKTEKRKNRTTNDFFHPFVWFFPPYVFRFCWVLGVTWVSCRSAVAQSYRRRQHKN